MTYCLCSDPDYCLRFSDSDYRQRAIAYRLEKGAPLPKLEFSCSHDGGSRTEDGHWQCSHCGHLFDNYEAWGAQTGNMAAVEAVKAAIEADLA